MTTSVDARFWDIRDDLLMWLNLNLLALETEIDAIVLFDWITESCNNYLHRATLISDCRNLLNKIVKSVIEKLFT